MHTWYRGLRLSRNSYGSPGESLPAANKQPLKYVLSCAPEWNARIFETLAWAAYLKDWPGPAPQERPTGYIVILATERGLGGCMFGAIKRERLAEALCLPPELAVQLVIAIGRPVEKVVLEDLPSDRSIRYYRDPDGTHHVPGRSEEELIHAFYG